MSHSFGIILCIFKSILPKCIRNGKNCLWERSKDAFIDEAVCGCYSIIILNVMLNEDDYAEHVFYVIYHSVEQYFRK